MRTPTTSEIARIDRLVKNAGQNIIDAIGELKTMKAQTNERTIETKSPELQKEKSHETESAQ